jgi:predicted metal-dependent hydrolase
MNKTIQLGEISIQVTRKPVKHVHLSVHPPAGRVTLVAPVATGLDVARAYAISRLGWIRDQQSKLRSQAREAPRKLVERESHYLWGRRHLLTIAQRETKPSVSLDHRRITLTVRPGSEAQQRADVLHRWHKSLLHEVVPGIIKKWESKLKVEVTGYFLQRMKTKWGSCNPAASTIRLNTELAKKSPECLEYVLAHELTHLIEPTHSDRFRSIMDQHLSQWPHMRDELNRGALAYESWSH